MTENAPQTKRPSARRVTDAEIKGTYLSLKRAGKNPSSYAIRAAVGGSSERVLRIIREMEAKEAADGAGGKEEATENTELLLTPRLPRIEAEPLPAVADIRRDVTGAVSRQPPDETDHTGKPPPAETPIALAEAMSPAKPAVALPVAQTEPMPGNRAKKDVNELARAARQDEGDPHAIIAALRQQMAQLSRLLIEEQRAHAETQRRHLELVSMMKLL